MTEPRHVFVSSTRRGFMVRRRVCGREVRGAHTDIEVRPALHACVRSRDNVLELLRFLYGGSSITRTVNRQPDVVLEMSRTSESGSRQVQKTKLWKLWEWSNVIRFPCGCTLQHRIGTSCRSSLLSALFGSLVTNLRRCHWQVLPGGRWIAG